MKEEKNKFVILGKVMDELEKHKNSRDRNTREKALMAKRNIDQMIFDNLIEVRGDYGDEFADQVFHIIFTKLRMNNDLLLITQDYSLGTELLSLNKSKSVQASKKIKVKRINSFGQLMNFKSQYKTKNRETQRLIESQCLKADMTLKNEDGNKSDKMQNSITEYGYSQGKNKKEFETEIERSSYTLSQEWDILMDACKDLCITSYDLKDRLLQYGVEISNPRTELTECQKQRIWEVAMDECMVFEPEDLELVHKLLHYKRNKENIDVSEIKKLCELLSTIDGFRKYQNDYFLMYLIKIENIPYFNEIITDNEIIGFIIEGLKNLNKKNNSTKQSLLYLKEIVNKSGILPNKLEIMYNVMSSESFDVSLLKHIDFICDCLKEENTWEFGKKFFHLIDTIVDEDVYKIIWTNNNVIDFVIKNCLNDINEEKIRCKKFFDNIFLAQNSHGLLDDLLEIILFRRKYLKSRYSLIISTLMENTNFDKYIQYCKNNNAEIIPELIFYNSENY